MFSGPFEFYSVCWHHLEVKGNALVLGQKIFLVSLASSYRVLGQVTSGWHYHIGACPSIFFGSGLKMSVWGSIPLPASWLAAGKSSPKQRIPHPQQETGNSNLIKKLYSFLDLDNLVMVIQAKVSSWLAYFNALCGRLPLKSVWKLCMRLNMAALLLLAIRWIKNIVHMFKQLYWLPVIFHFQFKVLVV